MSYMSYELPLHVRGGSCKVLFPVMHLVFVIGLLAGLLYQIVYLL